MNNHICVDKYVFKLLENSNQKKVIGNYWFLMYEKSIGIFY